MSSDIITFEDAIEHVLDVFNLGRDARSLRMARRAVQESHRSFPRKHKWSYYERQGQIHTIASQSAGTITYVHSGGTNEREITLSGSTWPEPGDLHLYKILINQRQYDIDERKSDTVLTLTSKSNPGSDVAAGASYTLFKSKYALPSGFRRMANDGGEPVAISRGFRLSYVDPSDLLAIQVGNQTPSQETNYTIWSAGEFLGSSVLEIAPPPNRDETYDFVYEAGGRNPTLRSDRYITGTATTNGTTTVTGTDTVWSSSMVGCVIRFAAVGSDSPPSGLAFGLDDNALPYEVQRVVTSVASATSLTLDAAVTTLSGVKYSISDPIDLDPLVMQEAFLRECESKFSRVSSRDDRNERASEAKISLTEARIADNRQRELQIGNSGDRSGWSLGDWAINEPYGGSVIT